jgi:hypothetical protein
MRLSIFCLVPFSFATAANLRRSRGAGFVADAAAHDEVHRQMFRLELNNHKGVQYTAPVTLDNQELEAVYDTGSFEVMVLSRQCSVCSLHSGLNFYDNSSSKFFQKGDRPLENHHFAGGSVAARQDFETIHVGKMDSVFKVDHMAFWQVVHTDMSVWMNKKANFNAIVGLGHRGSVPDTPEDAKPMDSLIERTGTQRFAICLVRGPSNPGYLVFNPPHDFTATDFGAMFRRIAVIGEHHWAVKLNSVTVRWGDKTSSSCSEDQPCVGIVDSGTSLMGVPPNAVNMVMDVIQDVQYDCNNLDKLPELIFELDGHKFVMPAAAYTVQFGGSTAKPERCLPAFTDFDMRSPKGTVWILGMPFLRHFYTVFDRKEPSIYVAEQGANCEPAAQTANPVGGGGTFINATGGYQSERSQVAVVDMNEARLPSWAHGQKFMDL